MGHVRLGKLPATRKWQHVIELLSDEPSVPHLANAVQQAADRSLGNAVKDPGFVEALWLLLQIPKAAKSPDFAGELRKIGIHVPPEPTMADLIAELDLVLEQTRSRSNSPATDFGVLAKNAAISALQGMLQDRLPSLWEATAEDERTTLATFTSTERFSDLAQRFFTELLEGHIQYFLDREIPHHIRSGSFVPSVTDTIVFDEAVEHHCMETTLIMRAFARDWLGRNQFHLEKELTRQDVAGFAAHVFTKIRAELSARGAPQ